MNLSYRCIAWKIQFWIWAKNTLFWNHFSLNIKYLPQCLWRTKLYFILYYEVAFNLYSIQIFLLNLGIKIIKPNSFIVIFFIYHVCSNKSSYLYWHQLIYIISNLKLIPFSWKRLRHPFFSHFQCFYPIANPIWSELDQSSSAHKTVGSLKQHGRIARAGELYPSSIIVYF